MHHTLIHGANDSRSSSERAEPKIEESKPDSSVSKLESVQSLRAAIANGANLNPTPVILATATVLVRSDEGRSLRLRALLDSGSEATFITERAAQALHSRRIKTKVRVSGLGGRCNSVANFRTSINLSSCNHEVATVKVNALILPNLISCSRLSKVDYSNCSHLRGLNLADTDASLYKRIDLLIGADIYGSILLEGLRKGSSTEPVAQRTVFGWVLFGPCSFDNNNAQDLTRVRTSAHTLHAKVSESESIDLQRFWELEEVLPSSPSLSEDEKRCENHFVSTHSRTTSGRYVIQLPFKRDKIPALGPSLQVASCCFSKLENRLSKDVKLHQAYCDFLSEYEGLGHMIQLTPSELNRSPVYYMPHHPVLRQSSSSPLRVVFNASSRTNTGTSLNDCLLPGPKLQKDLPSILLRWRTHRLVYIADIAKMFRQILVHPSDADYQRILWRPDAEQPLVHYQLLTVTYGTTSAPFLAMRVLKQLCLDEGSRFPLAVEALEHSIYVDDVLFGAHDTTTILDTRCQLNSLLSRGGFHLRKWASNFDELLKDIPLSDRLNPDFIFFQEDAPVKALGLRWNPSLDCFSFEFVPSNTANVSKRHVLSVISRIFDPLGLIAPVVISAKLFLQELWIRKVEWDAHLPHDLLDGWSKFVTDLAQLEAIRIPRWSNQCPETLGVELHGFADASNRAYAAVVYIRVMNEMDQFHVTLLASKTKVAPIKTISIPRLELCAARLLSLLIQFVQNALGLEKVPVHCWSDSTVTLAWISRHPSHWKTFVANRVSEIHSLLPDAKWGYVSSRLNPADCASRGVDVTTLKNLTLWWKGPPWLIQHSSAWPEQPLWKAQEHDVEKRSIQVLTAQNETSEWELPYEISSWPRLLRITAYCFMFLNNLLARTSYPRPPFTFDSTDLTAAIKEARSFWIKYVQEIHYSREKRAIQTDRPIEKNSKLKGLSPFLDSTGLIRVGGRLENASLSYEEKHPVILPSHRIAELLIEQAHKRCLHGGTQLTMRTIRQNFWIINVRRLVKSHIYKCIVCARYRASPVTQVMGDLPKSRITPSRPFQHSGVDYAGPFQVLPITGRGQRAYKAYVALFVCFPTRAIHLELVNDYTTTGFLAAFKRFSARRGLPTVMYSDNGTNFQGAERELARAFKSLIRDSELQAHLASDGISWRFIPPSAPHFGGLWEAGVRSMKHHLRRIVGSHTLSIEEFTTLLSQIEACLNSRPIASLSADPDDLSSLTPGHFLIGGPLVSMPQESVLDLSESRLSRWQRVRRLNERFWKLWSKDYLHNLQQKLKWQKSCPNLRVGELVLVRNDLLPPAKWSLGRVEKLYPDKNNRIRVVDVKTITGTYKRPISQLCRLPADSEETQTKEDPHGGRHAR